MIETTAQDPILALKARMGKLTHLEFHTLDLKEVHYQIGAQVKTQVWKILASKVGGLSPDQMAGELETVRQAQAALRAKMTSPELPPSIRSALHEYLDCLSAWSKGAGLESFPQLPGGALSALDLALLLQKERVGCQTGVYRLTGGSAVLWHTEEDAEPEPGSRFDRLRWVSFPVLEAGKIIEVHAFLYPDLLPGPSFGWRSDRYIQAVDSLPLKPCAQGPALLANIATWVTLRLGGTVDPSTVIEMLEPYWDGYAVNILWEDRSQPAACTLEFAGSRLENRRLGNRPGDFLFQVNLFSGESCEMAAAYEDISVPRRRPLEARQKRTEQALSEMKPGSPAIQDFYRLLCSAAGDDYAYANVDVKAHFVGRLAPGEMEVWFGPGPALEGDCADLTCLHC